MGSIPKKRSGFIVDLEKLESEPSPHLSGSNSDDDDPALDPLSPKF